MCFPLPGKDMFLDKIAFLSPDSVNPPQTVTLKLQMSLHPLSWSAKAIKSCEFPHNGIMSELCGLCLLSLPTAIPYSLLFSISPQHLPMYSGVPEGLVQSDRTHCFFCILKITFLKELIMSKWVKKACILVTQQGWPCMLYLLCFLTKSEAV